MAQEAATFKLVLAAGSEVDDDRLETLTAQLRRELLEGGVNSADRVRGHSAGEGARGDPLTLGALAVTLAPAVITAAVQVIQSWLKRHDGSTITLERAGEKIVMTGNPSKEQQRLTEAWIARHNA